MPILSRYAHLTVLATLVAFAAACRATSAGPSPGSAPTPAGTIRVVSTASSLPISLTELAEIASRADVVFFGEEHTDPETHRIEFALLEAIGGMRTDVILSLEMFERDVQGTLDDYISGRLPETEFLAKSRPWPRYATDYRPMVEFAKSKGWPVIASNVPRQIASAVGRRGLAALDSLPAGERGYAARDIICPNDDYRRRFFDEMKGHSSGSAAPAPGDSLPTVVAERFYLAQCVKDETMGESIADARQRLGLGALVVHYDGSFHSDFGAGTAERLRRRAPSARTLVISAVPVPDPTAGVVTNSKRADYVIFTRAEAKPSGTR
ncbi:MAG: ChaN family lipoprotein [Gemmatimonadaceae bacterium]